MPTAQAQPDVVFIVSISSDIGTQLALRYLEKGAVVCGTFRNAPPRILSENPKVSLVKCDVAHPDCAKTISSFFNETGLNWNIFISCVGQLSPIGLFFESNFETWNQSVHINSTDQLRVLHSAYPFRRLNETCHTVFFAGGGTNNPFRSYSAYCLGKIALIKMCELIDDETTDLNAFIVGTGWVRTKIHEQTMAAGGRAGSNRASTAEFLNDPGKGTSFDDIAAMIDWGVSQGRKVTGGRNFSIVHDSWRQGGRELAATLTSNSNLFKLRRNGNK